MEKKSESAGFNSESPKDLLENYSMSLKAGNRSHKTIDWYLGILKMYFGFLSQGNMLKPVDQMGSQELQAYLLHLEERSRWPENKHIKNKGILSPSSIQGYARAIKVFWGWLLKEGLINENPLVKFPLPKVPQNIIKTLTAEDMKKLLNAVDRSTPVGNRLYCVLLVLIDTGVRIGELVSITMPDINLPLGTIKVTGKGMKERIVPFGSITRKALINYIANSRLYISKIESDYLFPTKYGDHISVNSIQQALRRLAKKVGLPGCHPHLFRHTFATMFIASDGSPPILKEIMGHRSFQTTEKYIHPKAEDLKIQYQIHSPITEIFTKK